MEKLNGEIKEILTTFKTDLPGIRVKKLLKLVRVVQAGIKVLGDTDIQTIEVYENGHSVLVSRIDHLWEINIDGATILLSKNRVFDQHGKTCQCSELAPGVIHTILNAA